jgi:hypothetical protein
MKWGSSPGGPKHRGEDFTIVRYVFAVWGENSPSDNGMSGTDLWIALHWNYSYEAMGSGQKAWAKTTYRGARCPSERRE